MDAAERASRFRRAPATPSRAEFEATPNRNGNIYRRGCGLLWGERMESNGGPGGALGA